MSSYGATKQSRDICSRQTDGNKAFVLSHEPYLFSEFTLEICIASSRACEAWM
jgi:hypothetical protein